MTISLSRSLPVEDSSRNNDRFGNNERETFADDNAREKGWVAEMGRSLDCVETLFSSDLSLPRWLNRAVLSQVHSRRIFVVQMAKGGYF